ncbi:GPR endopeptidase [Paludicola sp. MB14-C6]|uniref:GPR endopeptidase n=1 Tax=Paludihabitans sp. MB14-C6 TaxID=3070656 RepID=UPI0027DD6E05|nr:GPR endopeptidase [Paludicola sp. MB14-C6]WMJ23953.1 GPR endopeptidase [Paludicola sp. MB14-C6]
MSIRTDLALERLEINGEITPAGVTKQEDNKDGMLIVKVNIETDEASKLLNKPKGTYVTFNVSDFKVPSDSFEKEVEIVAKELSSMFPENKNGALIVGLGNSDITPDALGPKAISYTFATRHIDDDLKKAIGLEGICAVSAIAPGVLGQTGIETAEVVASLVKELNPSFVVVIDALAAKSIDRLGTTVQVSNTGISPGSGVQNRRKELSETTLGIPVISVGVPMVVDMTTIAYDLLGEGNQSCKVSDNGRTMMVTPREIDVVVEHAAKLVAFSINKALQPSLALEDLVALVG